MFNDLGKNFYFVKQEKAIGEMLVKRVLECQIGSTQQHLTKLND